MDLKKEKINIILIATSIVLFFTYILSFTNFSSTDKRKLVKTALVNNKYIDSINRFELSQGEQKITLSKEKAGGGDVWFILAKNNTKILPADKELINNFIINNSDFSDSIFNECELKNVCFDGVKLCNSEFLRGNFSNVDFSSCDICGINFDKDSIDGIIIDRFQAFYIVSLFGVKIKD
mgnify:CR=1 FL=1